MHQSSYLKMESFREGYLASSENESLKIYDLGSQDVNGTYRPLFETPNWQYIGVDGDNVDVVLKNPYRLKEIPTGSADVVISDQAFEYVEYFWITILEVARALKKGGIGCIIAPSGGVEHR